MTNQLFLCLSVVVVLFAVNNRIGCDATSASTYGYNVTVKTASTKFDDHNGKLKLTVQFKDGNNNKQEDFVLTPNDINIAVNKEYSSLIASFAPLANITSVYLRWTLASPYNPIYAIKKPSIYFDPIVFSLTTTDPQTLMSVTQSRKFCSPTTPVAIKHADGVSFYPCA